MKKAKMEESSNSSQCKQDPHYKPWFFPEKICITFCKFFPSFPQESQAVLGMSIWHNFCKSFPPADTDCEEQDSDPVLKELRIYLKILN